MCPALRGRLKSLIPSGLCPVLFPGPPLPGWWWQRWSIRAPFPLLPAWLPGRSNHCSFYPRGRVLRHADSHAPTQAPQVSQPTGSDGLVPRSCFSFHRRPSRCAQGHVFPGQTLSPSPSEVVFFFKTKTKTVARWVK
jgi:hypothetical protein